MYVGCDRFKHGDCARVLARAFIDDPMMEYVFGPYETKEQQYVEFFTAAVSLGHSAKQDHCVNIMYDKGNVYAPEGPQNVRGCSVWCPPGMIPGAGAMIMAFSKYAFSWG